MGLQPRTQARSSTGGSSRITHSFPDHSTHEDGGDPESCTFPFLLEEDICLLVKLGQGGERVNKAAMIAQHSPRMT